MRLLPIIGMYAFRSFQPARMAKTLGLEALIFAPLVRLSCSGRRPLTRTARVAFASAAIAGVALSVWLDGGLAFR